MGEPNYCACDIFPCAQHAPSTTAGEVGDKLESLRTLKAGWDGYDADPISEPAINRAKQIVQAVPGGWFAAPLSDGGVQVEVDNFEIEVTPEGHIFVACLDLNGELFAGILSTDERRDETIRAEATAAAYLDAADYVENRCPRNEPHEGCRHRKLAAELRSKAE